MVPGAEPGGALGDEPEEDGAAGLSPHIFSHQYWVRSM